MTAGSRRFIAWLPLIACALLLCRPAWPLGQTLTKEQLQRLLKVVDTRGSRASIPPNVASVLELNAGQHRPDIKQAAYLDEDGNKHGFAPLRDGSGYFLFRSGAALGQSVYRVDPDLHLVRAARSLMKNGPMIALPPDEAQKELDQEFGRWSKVLSPRGPASLPPKLPLVRPAPGASPAPAPAPATAPAPAPAKP